MCLNHSKRLSKAPPPPLNPLFVWLLRVPFKWQSPKTGAPPISQFVDGRHFGAPNKGIERSARESVRRAPSTTTRLMGTRGLLFGSMANDAMEREGKAAGVVRAASHLADVCVLCV